MHRDFNQKLDGIQQHVDQKLDTLQKDVTDLKVGVGRLEEKADGLSKRVDSQEFISRGILIGLIVAILGGLAKLFGFAGNP
ncbi:MAG: hypothetical protein HC890_20100 [Chloroflexaceae bacterium]|nr:hypothetical protein [Chloroflexaceae bacterium]